MNPLPPSGPGASVRAARDLGALLIVALLLGGGGVAYGLVNLAIQLAALLALALHRDAVFTFWRSAPLTLRLLCGGTIALPLLQLAPLPPAIWQGLPARELVSEALSAAGLAAGWRPASLDPARTLVAALGLLAPLAIFAIGWSLSRQALLCTGWLVVALGCAHFVWGIPQVLSQGAVGVPYPEIPMPGVLFGGFANRNSTGLFFVLSLALALALPLPQRWAQWAGLLRTGLATIFVFGVILTQSRSAMVLAALPFALAGMRLARNGGKWRLAPVAVVALAAALTVALALVSGSRIASALERFSGGDGYRLELWQDAGYAAQRYWPVGSGMGTFDEVIQLDESLEHLTMRTAGRGHNDYLEWLVEGGLPAAALMLSWLAMIAGLAWLARRSPQRWLAWTGGAMLLAIATQSLTDYPLRNQAMLATAAFALLLLARFGNSLQEDAQ